MTSVPKERKDDTILQNTEHGYEETPVEDVPLSDAAGEGRREGGRRRKV